MRKEIGCLLFVFFGGLVSSAQQAISSAGGDASGAGGTVSYTIGQAAFSSLAGIEGIVVQGVQQPYEILVISSAKDNNGIIPELSVYPNPTRENLQLKIENFTAGTFAYQLIDLNGKLLENKKLDGTETNIEMKLLTPSVYYLKVTYNSKEIRTFKIIKH